MRSSFPSRRLLLCLAIVLLPALPGAHLPSAQAQGTLPSALAALLGTDAGARRQALATLRADPAAAREALRTVLQREQPPPEAWRLAHRLVEFGTTEDIPLLLALRARAGTPWARGVYGGAARALYEPVGDATQLTTVVQDFSFLQTGRPESGPAAAGGKWQVTDWSVATYHRNGVPLRRIRQVQGLRGRTYDTREALAAALKRQVGARAWKENEAQLLAGVEQVQVPVRIAGRVRVRLRNPLEHPLLLALELDAWFGRIAVARGAPSQNGAPRATAARIGAWQYLPARGAALVTLPVQLEGTVDRPQIRLDLRLSEVDGPFVPTLHKLYLSHQP